MKLSQYQEDYYLFTGKVSDITRQLGLAGIALIWIFKSEVNNKILLSNELVCAAIFIIASLFSDLIQYIYQSIVWSVFYHNQKSKGKNDDDIIKTPEKLNYFSWIVFAIKVLLVFLAYLKILIYLYNKIN